MFDEKPSRPPLAERMRPDTIDGFVGQDAVVGPGTLLRGSIESDDLDSLVLWGPPGSGKTTLARIIAGRTAARFVPFSAVLSGIKDVQKVMRSAEEHRRAYGQRTILFVDEIHRFNRAQQDAFLPYVERGDIVLIGATTENPSFQVNAALLSRCRVIVLEPLGADRIETLVRRALSDPRGLAGSNLMLDDGLIARLARASRGDARAAYNVLELLARAVPPGEDGVRKANDGHLTEALQRPAPPSGRSGDEHYDLLSALHKSMRNSDPDATVYWVTRMLESGEDPLTIARRMVRFASEDVGLADPRALAIALAAKDAVHFLGLPEGSLALLEAGVYLASSPRSDALQRAHDEALADIRAGIAPPVPASLRNAPTALMSRLGHGRGYVHAHDVEQGVSGMESLPPELSGKRYYRPTDRGYEKTMRERLAGIEDRRRRAASGPPRPGPGRPAGR